MMTCLFTDLSLLQKKVAKVAKKSQRGGVKAAHASLGSTTAPSPCENPISGSFPVVHSVGGADTARLHDENEHRHRRKVHTSIAQHQGPLTLVRFVAAGARVAHQARAVVATRSSSGKTGSLFKLKTCSVDLPSVKRSVAPKVS